MARIASSRSARSKKTTSSSSTRGAKRPSDSSPRGALAEDRGSYFRSATLEEIREMDERGELHPSSRDAAEIELDAAFWKSAALLMPEERPKTSVHLRVDHDVVEWFRGRGKGHLTRMNAVLRAYYEANRKKKP